MLVRRGQVEAVDLPGWELEFADEFDGSALRTDLWVPHYLPHWTTPDRSAARYDLADGILRLRIDTDQPAWRDEDGELRVSNLQSGTCSGPVGSPFGQHRHRSDLVVTTPQPNRRLYTPSAGRVEATLRANLDPTTMLACWLVGFEEAPDQAGEICLVELFGNQIGRQHSSLNVGVKAHHDPRLHDDMATVQLELDATNWHRYSAVWDSSAVSFSVDDQLIRTVEQSITYPMQLMLDLFEFPTGCRRDPRDYPKTGEVRSVRGYRRPDG